MFDLNHEIAQWRQSMARGGVKDPAVLDELESHLRDFVEQAVRSGGDVEMAFKAGLARIGQPGVLKREFLRADKMPLLAGIAARLDDSRKCAWAAMALSVLVAAAFYAWRVRDTPLYQSVATLQVLRPGPHSVVVPRELVMDEDIRAAEDLNVFVRILHSQQLRTRVAESLTVTEQEIVRRGVTARDAATATDPGSDRLGVLRVMPRPGSFLISLAIVHEDPEAAALIANRCVQQCGLLLQRGRSGNSNMINFRLIDVPQRAAHPISPDRAKILSMALGIVLVVFTSLVAIFAALRKLSRLGRNDGPQVRTS